MHIRRRLRTDEGFQADREIARLSSRLDVSEARCSQTWHDLPHYAFKVENQIGPFLHVSLKPRGRFSSAPDSLDYGSFTPNSTEHFTGHPDFRCYIRLRI